MFEFYQENSENKYSSGLYNKHLLYTFISGHPHAKKEIKFISLAWKPLLDVDLFSVPVLKRLLAVWNLNVHMMVLRMMRVGGGVRPSLWDSYLNWVFQSRFINARLLLALRITSRAMFATPVLHFALDN